MAVGTQTAESVRFVQIEPTTRCNFTCGFCTGRQMDQSNISVETFQGILDAFPAIQHIELQGEGEPLLHKDFFAMAALARDRGIRISMITNGSLLTNAAVDGILETGILAVRVSIESSDPAGFQKIRGGKLDKVCGGIERLIAARNRSGRSDPSVGFAVTVLRSTIDGLPGIAELYDKLGMDGGIGVQPLNQMTDYLNVYDKDISREALDRHAARKLWKALAASPKINQLMRDGGGGNHFYSEFLKSVQTPHGCPWVRGGLYVNRHGEATTCCMVKDTEQHTLGRIGKSTDREILEARAGIDSALLRGVVPAQCTGCGHISKLEKPQRSGRQDRKAKSSAAGLRYYDPTNGSAETQPVLSRQEQSGVAPRASEPSRTSAAPLSTRAHPDLDIQRPFDAAVVIQTLVRPTLTRAVESVYAQDLDGSVQILIGIDDPKADLGQLDALVQECPDNMAVTIFNPGYSTFVPNGGMHPAMGGALRPILSYTANSQHVAYLDDDNWWAPNHLSNLKEAIKDHDWAFSLRWFVDAATGEPRCIDDWESVGPGAGIFEDVHDGFVDPNVLMVDTRACEPALRLWNVPLYAGGKGEDRVVFKHLKSQHPFNCTFQATSFYEMDPDDGLHDLRTQTIARRRSEVQSDADMERRLNHVPPRIRGSSRKWLIRNLPQESAGALVGVGDGDFAERLLDAANPAEMNLIEGPDETAEYESLLTRIEGPIREGRIKVHRENALQAINTMPDNYLHWAYLGGGQSYEDTKRTLEFFLLKLRKGGWIAGGGFGAGTGVQQAVDEILAKGGARLVKIAGDLFVLRKREGASPKPRNDSLRTLRTPTMSEIRGKTWQGAAGTVSPDDFWTHNRSTLSLGEVQDRQDISLYCFDDQDRQALFVKIPSGKDRRGSSVYFRTQYENADSVISVPYESLPAYCGEQDAAPVFIFSIGRTGATLLSKVLGLAPNATSLSEPGLYTQILQLRGAEYRKVGSKRNRELTELLRLGTQCLQKNMTSTEHPNLVLKVRDQCMAISDLVFAAFPQAKMIFLHREPEDWARASIRAPGYSGEELAQIWDEAGERFRGLAANGANVYALSYDTLRSDGISAVAKAAKFCGLQPPPQDAVREFLGSHFGSEDSTEATPEEDDQLKIFLRHIDRTASPFEV